MGLCFCTGNFSSIFFCQNLLNMHTYSFALQVIVEVPYVLIQTAEFVIIPYPMIGYYASAYKVFWYFYTVFCSLLYFNYLGMALVSLTPNVMVAAILASFFYKIYNIFSGFVIPQPVSCCPHSKEYLLITFESNIIAL